MAATLINTSLDQLDLIKNCIPNISLQKKELKISFKSKWNH